MDNNLKQYEYFKTELGTLYCGDCSKIMQEFNNVDLTITSPPYDNLRDYEDYKFDFHKTAKELFRLTKIGGILVWIVGDATVNGSETGMSFRQALYFKELGFNLHDTMIYEKTGFSNPSNNRYHQVFEYMFILSNGKPNIFNPIKDKKNTQSGLNKSSTSRQITGETIEVKDVYVLEYGMRYNIWKYEAGFMKSTVDKFAYKHPAIFPEKLAQDHIITWSNKNDLILDCFMGSGTIAKMCEKLDRRWIGIEISEKYCEIAKQRIEVETKQGKFNLEI